jgi:hypothetical protein
VEIAAARRGRWPAPPSPLPEILPPPGADRTEIDYFGGDDGGGGGGESKMQAQQANAIKASMSIPTVLNRPNFNGLSTLSHTPPIPPSFGNAPPNSLLPPPLMRPTSRPMVPMNAVTSPPTSGTSSTGGGGTGKLSAQDLSFFEGL